MRFLLYEMLCYVKGHCALYLINEVEKKLSAKTI